MLENLFNYALAPLAEPWCGLCRGVSGVFSRPHTRTGAMLCWKISVESSKSTTVITLEQHIFFGQSANRIAIVVLISWLVSPSPRNLCGRRCGSGPPSGSPLWVPPTRSSLRCSCVPDERGRPQFVQPTQPATSQELVRNIKKKTGLEFSEFGR